MSRPATVADLRRIAAGMPHVTEYRGATRSDTSERPGTTERPVYQVGGRSFVFFRSPRPDAVNSATGRRLEDVIVIWVTSEAEKAALVQDPASPPPRLTSTVICRCWCRRIDYRRSVSTN